MQSNSQILSTAKSEYFAAVRTLIGWVLTASLPSSIGIRAILFKCQDEDVGLADRKKKWYELQTVWDV